MINEKMYKLGSERSEIRELFEYGKRLKAEMGEENVFDFSLGNPSIPCPDEVNSTLVNLITKEGARDLHGYTSGEGDINTRRAIARKIGLDHSFHVTEDYLYMTAGAAAALACALCAVATEGEEIVVLAPYFPEYKVFAERAGATVKAVKCIEGSFEPDVEAIEAAINRKTAAVIINSPNNPTGAVYTADTLKRCADMLTRKSRELGKAIYLIADEPYRELVFDGATVPFIPNYYDDTIVCYSYSKSLSLPGERIGYCMVSPRASDAEKVYSAIAGAGRSLGYVCAPSLMQKALPYLMNAKADITVYDTNRQLLLTKLTEYGYSVVDPKGAFYLFIKSPSGDGRAFSEAAKKQGLLVVPSESFGYDGYVRLSYCTKTQMIERSLPAFMKLAAEVGLIGE